MNSIFEALFAPVRRAIDLLVEMLKIQLAKLYVSAVDQSRLVFIALLAIIGAVLLAVAGFLLIHVALFIYLPWEIETKALILLILGLVYFLVPLIAVLRFCSRRMWLKLTRADEIVAKLAPDKKL